MKRYWELFTAAAGLGLGIAIVCSLTGAMAQQAPPEQKFGDFVKSHAELHLKLAELQLQQVEERNKAVRGAVPAVVVNRYRQSVASAKAMQEQINAATDQPDFALFVQSARAGEESARGEWESVKAAAEQSPETFDPLDIQVLEAKAKLAGLYATAARSVEGGSDADKLRWQLMLIEHQIQMLNDEVFNKRVSGSTLIRPRP